MPVCLVVSAASDDEYCDVSYAFIQIGLEYIDDLLSRSLVAQSIDPRPFSVEYLEWPAIYVTSLASSLLPDDIKDELMEDFNTFDDCGFKLLEIDNIDDVLYDGDRYRIGTSAVKFYCDASELRFEGTGKYDDAICYTSVVDIERLKDAFLEEFGDGN